MERSDRIEAKKTMFLDIYDDGRILLDVQAGCGPQMLDLLAKLSRLLPRHVSELDAAQDTPKDTCAQCKKSYRKSEGSIGCQKCAPGIQVSEVEFRKPLTNN